MLRRFMRIAVAAVSLAAALAVASPASAAPTTPQLDPIPYWVVGPSLTVTWSPSTFDRNTQIGLYNLEVRDTTLGVVKESPWLQGTSFTINGLVTGHKYVLRLRAGGFDGATLTLSPSDFDVFEVIPDFSKYLDEIYYEYIEWPPPPPDCKCGFELYTDDPVIYERLTSAVVVDNERINGVIVDTRGEVTAVSG